MMTSTVGSGKPTVVELPATAKLFRHRRQTNGAVCFATERLGGRRDALRWHGTANAKRAYAMFLIDEGGRASRTGIH